MVKTHIFTMPPHHYYSQYPACGGRLSFQKRRRGDQQPLSEVIVGDGESFEAALRRFNKKIQQAGILAEARRREFYERPAARRKRKEAKRRKR
jgi:small subunit ribosomal protein S21